MRKHGWMNDAGGMVWPEDLQERQNMARGLLGLEIVGNVDYWTLLAEDEVYNTFEAPWSSPERTQQPEEEQRRVVFQTLNPEQREAVRELLHRAMTGNLHSLCAALDQKLGGVTLRLDQPEDGHGEALEIHSPQQDELRYEQYQWLEDFSIVFGEDERSPTEA